MGVSLTSGEDAQYHKKSPQWIQASAGGWFSDSDDHCTATHKKAKQHQWRHLRVSGGGEPGLQKTSRLRLPANWLLTAWYGLKFFAEILTQSFTRRTLRRKKKKEKPAGNTHLCPLGLYLRLVPLDSSPQKAAGMGKRRRRSRCRHVSEEHPVATQPNTKSILTELKPVCCHVSKQHTDPSRTKLKGFWQSCFFVFVFLRSFYFYSISNLDLYWSMCILSHIHSRTIHKRSEADSRLELACFIFGN